MIDQQALAAGRTMLRQPVLPLAGIVQFLYLTGSFATVAEVVAELSEEIETSFARYPDPAGDLLPYLDLLRPLEGLKAGEVPPVRVIDPNGQPVDAMTATTALVTQNILTRELERINGLLCAPCNCTLCCVGPEAAMAQSFFEIPLEEAETDFFPVERIETEAAAGLRSNDEPVLRVDDHDFFDRPDPVLIRWRTGWSLILPRQSGCPNLESTGRCRIYADRPLVCRRPQIFPYVVEPVPDQGLSTVRLRQSLLAVMDCPYVRLVQDEIASYAAACELEMIFRTNKA